MCKAAMLFGLHFMWASHSSVELSIIEKAHGSGGGDGAWCGGGLGSLI